MFNKKLTSYYEVPSLIHSINPVIKILCTIILGIIILITNDIRYLSIIFIFSVLCMLLSHVPLRLYLSNNIFLLSIIMFIILINFITNTSFILSIISILKLVIFIIFSKILVYSTKSKDVTYGLEVILSPLKIFKINSYEIALIITLTLRFIPIIFYEEDKVIKSQKSRGFNLDGTLREKCDKIVAVILPTFILSLKRSDSIYNTLELREYGGNRTRYSKYRYSEMDSSILLSFIILLVIFIVVR